MIPWIKNTPDHKVYDGQQYLVAVRLRETWDYMVISIIVDDAGDEPEQQIETSEGDDWGWTWSDVDYFVETKHIEPGPINSSTQP